MPKTSIFSRALLVWLLLATTLVWAAAPTVQLDRNRVNVGDTVTLRLTADRSASGEPDFTPLEQDFDILRRSQSTVLSLINGVTSNTRQWTLELAPKRAGSLLIPALALGTEQTQATALEVVASGDASADADGGTKPLFIESTVDHQTPYVQQPFIYRIKLSFRLAPQQAALSDPQAEGATIERAGEDQSSEQTINGQRYAVIERAYLVIPQRSGPLTIQGPMLEAIIPDDRARQRDPFADLDDAFGGSFFQGMPGMGQPGRRIVERAQDLTLQIRAQPNGAASPWLPATSVQISDEWTPTPPVFKVGEPLTRTLTLTAQGVTAAQLPNLDTGSLDGVQVYPDQPRAEDLPGASPTAVKSVKIALVPTRPGPLILPEIRLDWWDTVADAPRVAVVPARTVEVAPAVASAAPPVPVAVPPIEPSVPIDTPQAATPSAPSVPNAIDADAGRNAAGWWPWLALMMGVAWLITLAWWFRERRGRQVAGVVIGAMPDVNETSLRAVRRQIERACLAGDARAARAGLIDWGRLRWPVQPPSGLGELAERLGGEGSDEILNALDRAIYAPATDAWDGAATWAQLAPRLSATATGGAMPPADPLPELYPH